MLRLAWAVLATAALIAGLLFSQRPPKPQTPLPTAPLDAPGRPKLSAGAPVGEPPKAELTNEALQSLMQEQAEELGIQAVGRQPEESPGFLGERLGRPGTREQAEAHIRRLAEMRRAVESGKGKPVPIEGKTAPVLAEPPAGGAPPTQ